jgi:hypothetical protein
MKNVCLTLSCFLACCTTAFTQQQDSLSAKIGNLEGSIGKEPKYYINVHTGYSLALGSTFKFYPDAVSAIETYQVGNSGISKTVTYSSPTKGLGQGVRFGFGGAYILNDFINLGLDFDYLKSTLAKNRDSVYQGVQLATGAGSADSYMYNQRIRTTYEASLLTVTPNITFKAVSRPKWFLYNKIGAIITFRPNSKQNTTETIHTRSGWQNFYKDSTSYNQTVYNWGIRNPAYGFMAGIGGQWRLSTTIRAFAELQFSHTVFVVKRRTVTDYMINGKDMLSSLPLSVRLIEFRTSFTQNQNSYDQNAPSRAVTERIPITYIGLQAGLSYRF